MVYIHQHYTQYITTNCVEIFHGTEHRSVLELEGLALAIIYTACKSELCSFCLCFNLLVGLI
jgi:hypothetical protein